MPCPIDAPSSFVFLQVDIEVLCPRSHCHWPSVLDQDGGFVAQVHSVGHVEIDEVAIGACASGNMIERIFFAAMFCDQLLSEL